MTRARYTQRTSGDVMAFSSGERTRWRCCDCGLVHDLLFSAKRGVIRVTVKRNGRATANSRRRVQRVKSSA